MERQWDGEQGLPPAPRAPPALQLPAQAAQHLAEQRLHPANAKEGDYFGLQNEQTKAIYTYLQCPTPTASSLQT